MSTAVLPARPAARGVGLRPRGVAWLIWRQNRIALLVVTLVFAGFMAYLLREHFRLDAAAARYQALRCTSAPSDACGRAELDLWQTNRDWPQVALGLVALPGLFGAVLAAQPLATDFERGRHLMLWSQSVSPQRWFAWRLALPGVALLLLSTTMSLTVSWIADWSHPYDVGPSFQTFGFYNLAPVYPAVTLAAFALGALVGLCLHRAIPALGVTLVLYGVLMVGIYKVYPFLLPLHRQILAGGFKFAQNDWVYHTGVVLNGRYAEFGQCPGTGCRGPEWVLYHPASEFAPMLWIETGLLVALAALLVLACYRRLRALTR